MKQIILDIFTIIFDDCENFIISISNFDSIHNISSYNYQIPTPSISEAIPGRHNEQFSFN